jgi:type VI secretion system protein ImpM
VQGFFGKIPSLGDFVTRDLPREFLDTWDNWLQRSVAESKAALGDAWLNTYLTSPIWRFVLLPGVCGESGWAGILMPSVDKVGRYFPLTFATSLGEDVQPFQIVEEAASWFTAAESLALTVLNEERIDVDTIKSSLGALDNTVMQGEATTQPILQGGEWGLRLTGVTSEAISSSVCNELVRFQVGPYSIWWTLGTDEFASMGLVAPDLPDPLCFSQLLAGSWGESPQTAVQEEVTSEIASTGESV